MDRKRVFVGLSGGVDSSVAAKRLMECGYDVVGVFIKVWQPDFIRCDWEKERVDAMRVAAHLGIPFLTCDAEAAYKEHVADYMISTYKSGLTPNPDVMCNEFVKFGSFYTWAREQGADCIATGHYAQIIEENGVFTLRSGVDKSKDQSYFLSRIESGLLPFLLFPIGDSLKENVREEARRAEIPTFNKADSQGICFLGQIDIRDFLSHYIELRPGIVRNKAGDVVGEHSGALIYTIGQRHGFTVHTPVGGNATPHYVTERSIETNEIIVDDIPPELATNEIITITDIREFGHGLESKMDAVFRYHGPRIPVVLDKKENGDGILMPYGEHTSIPSPGQVCVLYKGDECCGSGIIT